MKKLLLLLLSSIAFAETTDGADKNELSTLNLKNPIIFSETPVSDYFTYEEYVEWRNQNDPKREKNLLMKGALVNGTQMVKNQDDILKFDYTKVDVKNGNLSNVYQYKLLNDLKSATGFSLLDEPKDIYDTYFAFIDFNQNKEELIKHFVSYYKLAKAQDKNIIVFPISVDENGERVAYNFLKTFSLNKPSHILSLNEEAFYKTFSRIRANSDLSMLYMDSVLSNNIVYTQKFDFFNPITFLKLTKNNDTPYLTFHELVSEEKFKEFMEAK